MTRTDLLAGDSTMDPSVDLYIAGDQGILFELYYPYHRFRCPTDRYMVEYVGRQ